MQSWIALAACQKEKDRATCSFIEVLAKHQCLAWPFARDLYLSSPKKLMKIRRPRAAVHWNAKIKCLLCRLGFHRGGHAPMAERRKKPVVPITFHPPRAHSSAAATNWGFVSMHVTSTGYRRPRPVPVILQCPPTLHPVHDRFTSVWFTLLLAAYGSFTSTFNFLDASRKRVRVAIDSRCSRPLLTPRPGRGASGHAATLDCN